MGGAHFVHCVAINPNACAYFIKLGTYGTERPGSVRFLRRTIWGKGFEIFELRCAKACCGLIDFDNGIIRRIDPCARKIRKLSVRPSTVTTHRTNEVRSLRGGVVWVGKIAWYAKSKVWVRFCGWFWGWQEGVASDDFRTRPAFKWEIASSRDFVYRLF